MILTYLKWSATLFLIAGTLLNSLALYPYGPIVMVLSGAQWSIVSWIWKEKSLIVTNFTITAVGACGLIYNFA